MVLAKSTSRAGIAVVTGSEGLEKPLEELVSGVLCEVVEVDVVVYTDVAKEYAPAFPRDSEFRVAGWCTVELLDVVVGLREKIHEIMWGGNGRI